MVMTNTADLYFQRMQRNLKRKPLQNVNKHSIRAQPFHDCQVDERTSAD